MSRQNRATPLQIKVSHLSLDPPVALSSHSQQAGGQGERLGRLVEGIAALNFGFRKRIALQGGVAATVTPVALLCATKLVVSHASHVERRTQKNTRGGHKCRVVETESSYRPRKKKSLIWLKRDQKDTFFSSFCEETQNRLKPRGPNDQKNQSRSRFSSSIETVKSRSKVSISTSRIPHKNTQRTLPY